MTDEPTEAEIANYRSIIMQHMSDMPHDDNTMFMLTGPESRFSDAEPESMADTWNAKGWKAQGVECALLPPNALIFCCPDQDNLESFKGITH